ncbi:MAG: DNA-processing protein DprA [Lachnospiraceae bacterium]|nr:DNA-processing protein DprA [Lachnospiraceae bacterium]
MSQLAAEKEYRYWLCNLPGFGARKIATLLHWFGSAEEVWKSSRESFGKLVGETETSNRSFREADMIRLLDAKPKLEFFIEDYHKLKEKGIRFITPADSEYPERLRHLYDMPQSLYVKGNLPADEIPSAAIVGARSCSHYGEELSSVLAGELCSRGVNIISGMALGIDGAAHRGAIEAERRGCVKGCTEDCGGTYAVLGCGVDVCYPRNHYDIYQYLGGKSGLREAEDESAALRQPKKGGLLSEFPPGTQPYASNFPMRNRIISGLADMVIVVEARFRSGSLITADQALEQGRDVYAVPGRVTDPLSRGCNELIRQGAEIITDPVEFARNKFPKQDKINHNCKKSEIALALSEEKVYSCLDFNPMYLGTIVNLTGFSAQDTACILMQLMMKELVVETSKNYYALKFR